MERKPSFPQQMVLAQSHILLQRKREETAWEIGIQCPFSKARPGFSFQILDLEKRKENGEGEPFIVSWLISSQSF